MTQSIVVGTDGSKPAEEAVRQATEIAGRDGARLHLVTAYPNHQQIHERTTVWTNDPKGVIDTGAQQQGGNLEHIDLRRVAESLLERAERDAVAKGVEVETYAIQGHAADAILKVAKQHDADLIVVGSRGLTGIRRYFMGSVSSKVSEHASCSVMIVRAD